MRTQRIAPRFDVGRILQDGLRVGAQGFQIGIARTDETRETIAQVMRDVSTVPGYRGFLARRERSLAGAASLRLHAGIAQLTGATTLPAHRRRGVQTALLRARLAFASKEGCDLAVVTTQPGSVSQQNVMRQGFSLLYARAILSLPPPGKP